MKQSVEQTKGHKLIRTELLAPAGSYDCMRAAINAGADAVYMGGSRFGARAYAENPEQDNLLRAIDWVHVRGKKLYLTVNTLLKDEEISQELEKFLFPLYRQGLDAVIVQDVGVICFLTERFPQLPIHLSTQMTINTADAAKTIEALASSKKAANITRFVPSRELSLEEIRTLKAECDLEIETFVHGALCYSYSGQCLMSSLIGGRSGNRGRCAQPCRLPYRYMQAGAKETNDKVKYMISPKDICTLDILPELMEAGIDSFKIEGRMKGTGYVSGVTEGYRQCIDLYESLGGEGYREYLAEHPGYLEKIKECFMDLYNRGSFSHGFYDCAGGKSMMADERPNHNGVLVGEVKQVRGINAGIVLSEDIYAQDILEIRSQGEKVYEFTVGNGEERGNLFCTNFLPGSEVRPGMPVYRTRNQNLLDKLEDAYLKKDLQTEISGQFYMKTGETISFTVWSADGCEVVVFGDVAQAAQNQPMTEEKLREKLNKTGDTPFVFAQLLIETDRKSFCPVGKLNELRRTALESLKQKISEQYMRTDVSMSETVSEPQSVRTEIITPCIQLLVMTQEQLEAAIAVPEAEDIYLDITDFENEKIEDACKRIKNSGKTCYLALPRIIRKSALESLNALENVLANAYVDGYLLRNLDVYPLTSRICKQHSEKIMMADYPLYTMNRFAKGFWEQTMQYTTAPLELSYRELQQLGLCNMILPVYGRVAFMVTAQCPNRLAGKCSQYGDAVRSNRQSFLVDRLSKQLPIASHCKYCFATIHNSEVYSLAGCGQEIIELAPYAVRMDFTFETGKETNRVINTFITELKQGVTPDKEFFFRQTKGNFIRGVQ